MMSARYVMTEPLGRGLFRGVAVLSNGSKRDVAIMRVLPNLTKNDKFVAMFLDELRSTLRLRHQNVIEVLDIAKTPERVFYVVTEYLEGCYQNELIARGARFAVPQVINVIIECCKALACAHSLNVIHRDVCPRNIAVSTAGEVKLTDFGLAKVNSQIESSDPGVVKGKFGYLSPEAANGLEVDGRADVFGVGVVLWELLAARRLFFGETDYQTVELVRAARYVPLEGLDPEMDAIARKALARDVSDRYQTATALGDALTHYAASRRLAWSANDIAPLVRDVRSALVHQRSRAPLDSETYARIQSDVRRMTSVVFDDGGATPEGWN